MTRDSPDHKEPWSKTRTRAFAALHELRYIGNCMGGPVAGRAVVLIDEVQAALHNLTALMDSQSDEMSQRDIEVQKLKLSLKAERSKDEAAWQVSNYRTGEVQDLPPRLRDIFEENKHLRAKVAHYKARTSKAEGGLRQAENVIISLEDSNAQLANQVKACSLQPGELSAAASVRSDLMQAQDRIKELEHHLAALTGKLESERHQHKSELRALQRLAQEHRSVSSNSTSAAIRMYGGPSHVSPSPQASYDAGPPQPSPDPLSPGAVCEPSSPEGLGPASSPSMAAGGRGSRTSGYLSGITPHSQPLLPNMLRSHAGPASQGGRSLASYPPSPAHLNVTLSYSPNPGHTRSSPPPHGSRSHAPSPAMHLLPEHSAAAPFANRPSHVGAYAARRSTSPTPHGDSVRAVVGSTTLLRLLPGSSGRQHQHATTSVSPVGTSAPGTLAPSTHPHSVHQGGGDHPRAWSKSPGATRQGSGDHTTHHHHYHHPSSTLDHSPFPSPSPSPSPFGQFFTPDTGLPYLLSASAAQSRHTGSGGPRSPSGKAGGSRSREGGRGHVLSRIPAPEGVADAGPSLSPASGLAGLKSSSGSSLPLIAQESAAAAGEAAATESALVHVPPLILPSLASQQDGQPAASPPQLEQNQEQQQEEEEQRGFMRLPPVHELLSPKAGPAPDTSASGPDPLLPATPDDDDDQQQVFVTQPVTQDAAAHPEPETSAPSHRVGSPATAAPAVDAGPEGAPPPSYPSPPLDTSQPVPVSPPPAPAPAATLAPAAAAAAESRGGDTTEQTPGEPGPQGAHASGSGDTDAEQPNPE